MKIPDTKLEAHVVESVGLLGQYTFYILNLFNNNVKISDTNKKLIIYK